MRLPESRPLSTQCDMDGLPLRAAHVATVDVPRKAGRLFQRGEFTQHRRIIVPANGIKNIVDGVTAGTILVNVTADKDVVVQKITLSQIVLLLPCAASMPPGRLLLCRGWHLSTPLHIGSWPLGWPCANFCYTHGQKYGFPASTDACMPDGHSSLRLSK